MWFDLFLILYPLPCGAGLSLFNCLALSTNISFTTRLASSISAPSFLVCQFAIAERRSFSNLFEASFFEYFRIYRALSTFSPLMISATNLIFLGEDGQSLRRALMTSLLASFLAIALFCFLDPMIICFLYFCYHRDL